EDSSSRKSSTTTVPVDAQETDVTAVTAAVEFLAELPGRWACGRKTAAELGPLLAEAARAQGWELGADLVQQLTRRSQARRGAQSVLRERIEDLPRYRAARRALEQERERSATARVPGQQLALKDQPDAQRTAPLPEGVSPEQVEEARAFLLTLTGPWALAPETAARLAPSLAAKSLERGWEFDEKLRQQLMSNPGGVVNYQLVLERQRIACLPPRRNTPGRTGLSSAAARQKLIDACSACDAYGQTERNGMLVTCKHDRAPAATPERPALPQDPETPAPDTAPETAPAPEHQPTVERPSLVELLRSMQQPTF
ncbi:hypothetical protein ABZ371_31615, partial [Streptomyces sp. NPDC005899]|uniref:hypothetical protein n=1 Tax=Streptomyces sp. NPDC005899 TaxID=3155716 RepID=UPI0033FCF777